MTPRSHFEGEGIGTMGCYRAFGVRDGGRTA